MGPTSTVTASHNTEGAGTWGSFNTPVYATSRNSQLSNVPTLSPLGTDVKAAIDPTNPNMTGTHEIIERPSPVSGINPSPNTNIADPDAFSAHRVYNSANIRVFINHSTAYTTDSTHPAQNVHVYIRAPNNFEDGSELYPGTTPKTQNLANAIINSITVNNSTGDIYDFRENWSNKNFIYHGSMCELYNSTHFTGTYGKSNVYSAPKRRWFFDDSFLLSPPPGNRRTTFDARGRWVRNVAL